MNRSAISLLVALAMLAQPALSLAGVVGLCCCASPWGGETAATAADDGARGPATRSCCVLARSVDRGDAVPSESGVPTEREPERQGGGCDCPMPCGPSAGKVPAAVWSSSPGLPMVHRVGEGVERSPGVAHDGFALRLRRPPRAASLV